MYKLDLLGDLAALRARLKSVKASAAATAAEIVTLNTKVNNLIIESGTSDAETIAARTNDDTGITYDTLGDRLDTEYSEIKADLRNIQAEFETTTTGTRTLSYSDITWTDGYIKSDGTFVTHAAYEYSQKFPVSEGDTVVYDGLRSITGSSYLALAAYTDADACVLSESITGGDGSVLSGTYTVPSGIAYIRLSTYNWDGTNQFNSVTLPVTVTVNRIEDIEGDIAAIESEQTTQNNRITALEQAAEQSRYEYSVTGFDAFDINQAGYIHKTTGALTNYANAYTSDYISTENMVRITASMRAYNYNYSGFSAVIACYDAEHNYLPAKSLCSEGEMQTFVTVTGTVTIDSEIKYIRITKFTSGTNDTIEVVYTRSLEEDYADTKERVAAIEADIDSVWRGKNWFVFGTSMSDDDYPNSENNREPTGVFPKYLVELSGLIQYNHGRAGGTISLGGPYNATGQIYTEITNTDFSSADLITLEGFINDFAECIPLGELGDTTQETFYGALNLCIRYLSEHNTTATIVVITDPVGKEYTFTQGASAGLTQDYSTTKVNAIGLRQLDYSRAIIDTCQWLGVHCIDVGGKSQINEMHPEYIVDQCHQTELGGKQFAYTVWDELKNIHPNSDVTVSD